VLVDGMGEVCWSAGDPEYVTYMRSSAKPFQATILMLTGALDRFGLTDENIAVACGSHSGERRHVRTVMQTLRKAAVAPEALGCGIHELRHVEGLRLAATGLSPTPLHNNCSGKHAAMLAAAVALGAPLDTYLCQTHPVQLRLLGVVATCAGVPQTSIPIGIDGCGAPNFALPLRRIAQSFANLGRPTGMPDDIARALRRSRFAMQADPWLVAGTGEIDTLLMAAAPGRLIAKGGAEGLRCVALPDLGLGLCVKFESGHSDGVPSVMLAILKAIGIFGHELPKNLMPLDQPDVRNHRRAIVGRTRVQLKDELSTLGDLKLSSA
jgi:L-asparaginase II